MSEKRLSYVFTTFNTLIISGVALFTPILYIFLIKLGYSYTEVGIYLSVFWGASAISELPSGILADTIGQKQIVILSCIFRAVGLAFLVTDQFILLILSSIVTGVAEAMLSGSLTSWFMNQLEDKNSVPLDHILSRVALFSAMFSLIVGFVSAQFLFKIYLFLPIILSVIFFIMLAILIYFLLPEQKVINKEVHLRDGVKKIENTWIKTASNILKLFIENKLLVVVLLLLILPTIVDIGPSNQWQVAFNDEIGFLWIGISVMGMLTNLVIPKIPRIGTGLKEIVIYLIFDMLIVWLITLTEYNILFFMLHIAVFTIISVKISVYMHQQLITDDSLRSSFISTFYTLESLITMALLPLNGWITEQKSIFVAWHIFLIMSIALLLVYIAILYKKKDVLSQ